MSAIINFSVDLLKLKELPTFKGKNGAEYVNLTASLNNESKFGNNASFMASQSKEQRAAKEPKSYVGNGKVVWTDGQIEVAVKEEQEVDF